MCLETGSSLKGWNNVVILSGYTRGGSFVQAAELLQKFVKNRAMFLHLRQNARSLLANGGISVARAHHELSGSPTED